MAKASHMNNSPEQHLTKEYKLSISTKGGSVMNKFILVVSQSTMWPRSFRRRGCAAEPVSQDFEVAGVLMTVACAL